MYRLLLIVCLISLSGCASCKKVDFIKITPTNLGKEIKLLPSQPYGVYLQIENKTKIAIAQCQEHINGGVCIDLNPAEGTRLQFESDQFIEVDSATGLVLASHKPTSISYGMSCLIKNDGTQVCDTSTDSPTKQNVKTKSGAIQMVEEGRIENYRKSFDTTAEFIGVRRKKHLMLSWAGSFDRTYSLVVADKSLIIDSEKLIRLPNILVDGRSYKLPDITMKKVNEELCFMPHSLM